MKKCVEMCECCLKIKNELFNNSTKRGLNGLENFYHAEIEINIYITMSYNFSP